MLWMNLCVRCMHLSVELIGKQIGQHLICSDFCAACPAHATKLSGHDGIMLRGTSRTKNRQKAKCM